MIRKRILFIILAISSFSLFGQEHHDLSLLETDSTWTKEIFKFPISFAPGIQYEGFEEAQFPAGWRKQESNEFWSYIFVWNITSDEVLSEQDLEVNLQTYFDGLMKMNINGSKETGILNTMALIIEKENSNTASKYVGKVKTFDAFFTKKEMILNVEVDQYYCEEKKKSIIVFRFSPKAFSEDVWHKLRKVNLRAAVCDL